MASNPTFLEAWIRFRAVKIACLCRRRRTLILLDGSLLVLVSSIACWMGAMAGLVSGGLQACSAYVVLVLTTRLLLLARTGVYRTVTRYASIADALRITRALGLGTAVPGVLLWRTMGGRGHVVTLLLDFLLAAFGATGLRLVARCAPKDAPRGGVSRALVVGAGDAGEMIIRQMLRNRGSDHFPVGILDDDPVKHRKTIHGVPVIGSCRDAPDAASETGAQIIIIATPSATGSQMQSMIEKCGATRLPIRTVPPLKEILDGKLSEKQIRKVDITDLVNREPVTCDREPILECLRAKRVLVTGAAGSIGREICRMVLEFHPNALAAVDFCENGIFLLSRLRKNDSCERVSWL